MFLKPRAKKLLLDTRQRDQAKKRALSRLKDMLRYTHSVTCRRHFLLKYFGESSAEICGACDVCLGSHEAVIITADDEPLFRQILKYIRDDVPREKWFEELTASEKLRIPNLISWVYQEAYLESIDPLEETYRVTEKAETLLKDWEPAKE